MTEKSNTEIQLAMRIETQMYIELDGRYDREKLDDILTKIENYNPQSIEDYLDKLESKGIKVKSYIDTEDVVNNSDFVEIECDDILGAD